MGVEICVRDLKVGDIQVDEADGVTPMRRLLTVEHVLGDDVTHVTFEWVGHWATRAGYNNPVETTWPGEAVIQVLANIIEEIPV